MGFRVAYLPKPSFLSFLRPKVQHPASDEEVKGSASEAEVDVGVEVLSGAPDRAPLLGDLRVPPEASSSASPIGAPPFDSSTFASRGPTSDA